MSAKEKYQGVLELGESLAIKNGDVSMDGDVLKIKGEAATPLRKEPALGQNQKEIGGESPDDILANITVANESIFHNHTVVSGDTLGKIAKTY